MKRASTRIILSYLLLLAPLEACLDVGGDPEEPGGWEDIDEMEHDDDDLEREFVRPEDGVVFSDGTQGITDLAIPEDEADSAVGIVCDTGGTSILNSDEILQKGGSVCKGQGDGGSDQATGGEEPSPLP